MRSVILAVLFLMLVLPANAKPYLAIRELKTPRGITLWYVQDKTIPVLAMTFSLKGGAQLDPPGQEGIGNLLTTMLDEGAGARDSEMFQDAMESYGIGIGFRINRDSFNGVLKTTSGHEKLGFDLLRDALNDPHIAPEAVERMKQALSSALRLQQTDPEWLAQKTLFETLFAGHPYARPVEGVAEIIENFTADDVRKQRNRLFCRDHLKIAVAGDIDPAALSKQIDGIFGNWPQCAYTLPGAANILQGKGRVIKVPWQGAQSSVLMAQAGLTRNDKDWWAARILDFALGSGEFSSRLLEEVRVKRGLTYGVFTSIAPYDLGPLWLIQAGIDPAKTQEAVAVIKSIWGEVARNGLHPDEIREAQDYLIGSLPLALTSTDQIAAILLQLQEDDLPKDTLDRRAEEIHAVTLDDIKRVAKARLQQQELTTVIVGPIEEKKHERPDAKPGMAKPAKTEK